ncbi:MAG: hypothetical protein ACI8U4_001901 [Natronomonas sp.]|jgi:hypothetical protein
MNRRTLLQTIAVAGSVSLAGCETLLYGNESNERVATANSELSEAAAILNDIELTIDGELDISSGDFEGFSPADVTQHTNAANEALADHNSSAAEVLLVVSTVVEETAYQYEAIKGLFQAHFTYEQRLIDGDYEGARQAANNFGDRHAEVSDHGSAVTEHLASLKDAGYEEPVDGFSVGAWSREQSIFVDMADAMAPLRLGFNEQARGLLNLQRASINKNNEAYERAFDEMNSAQDWFEGTVESFGVSLNRGITYRRALIEDFLCLSEGHFEATEIGIDALEAYVNGSESEGDNLWEQMKKKTQQSSGGCS